MGEVWSPTTFERFVKSLDTSTNVAKIVTDSGEAYLKGLGNPEGPHALACEWVGTRLARLFDLQTLDHAILRIDATVDEIPFRKGGAVASGSAFCTRAEPGHVWGGGADELTALENPQDIVRLVVFDTWVRNRDRHHPDYAVRKPNRDNVFLSSRGAEAGKYRLLAIDHTHCLGDGGTLDKRISQIDKVRDKNVYGLFPEFCPYFQKEGLKRCVSDLRGVDAMAIRGVVNSIPVDWEVENSVRDALAEFLVGRALFVAETITGRLQTEDGAWAFL
jgi:hypothetical protein